MATKLSKNPEVVELLIDAGADVNRKDYVGKTAWDYIKENEDLKGTDVYWKMNDLRFQ